MRYIGAVSDTDILINLAKVDKLDVLEFLFEEIVIPAYVYEFEVRNKAGIYYSVIKNAVDKPGSIFKVLDRKVDSAINLLANDTIEDYKKVIGPGESECAGYAWALRIPIIISDNYTEHKWLDDQFITLTHRNILTLCVHFGDIDMVEGEVIFNNINSQLQYPTTVPFTEHQARSMNKFSQKGWDKYLGI